MPADEAGATGDKDQLRHSRDLGVSEQGKK
jgi:hypothetical protein